MSLDKKIKQATEERDALIQKAEALVNENDGPLKGVKKTRFDSYKD